MGTAGRDLNGDMRSLRDAFERRAFAWPGVECRWMFGSPCYLVGGKLFAFLLTDAVVLTTLSEAERVALAAELPCEEFLNGRQVMGGWSRVPVEREDDLDTLLPYTRRAYESALARSRAGPSPRRRPARHERRDG